MIVPLTNPLPQEWHRAMGCKVLKDNKTIVYLDCLIGYHVTPFRKRNSYLGRSTNAYTMGQ